MSIRRTRLVSGLVLLTYLATHFINHALGLISLEAMEAGRAWFLALWRNPLGTTVLYGSLTVHLSLAFYALYQRYHLRMPFWEALQLVLGLTIPLFLTVHVIGTRAAHEWFDVNDSYAIIVLSLWGVTPANGVRQAILVTVAWTHGCIGLYFWLRLRSWYSRAVPIFFGLALLLPVFALLGCAGWPRDFRLDRPGPGLVRTHSLRGERSQGQATRAFESRARLGAREFCRKSRPGAARSIGALSRTLAGELQEPLKIGVGIHSGPAVVGRMGYGEAVSLTAIGDTVNVASRLQDLGKEYSCQLVISEQVAQQAGLDVSSVPRDDLKVRNRREALTIFVINEVPAVVVTAQG